MSPQMDNPQPTPAGTGTTPRVSIVLPTFNRAYCLGETLRSIQSQTFTDWEVHVIDDGSTDGTSDVVHALREDDARIRYHYQRNGGVCSARNAGLRIAQGDLIAFLDSDDAWLPWKLAAQVACMERLPDIGMLWTDMIGVAADGTVVSRNHLRRFYSAYRRIGDDCIFQHARGFAELAPQLAGGDAALATAMVRWGDVYSSMITGNLVHTSTVLIRRERARAVGFFNEQFRTGEDYDFHLRTCYEGPVALLDAPAIRYRIAGGDDQLTATQYRVEIARNGLATRLAAIRRDPARIALPRHALRRVVAGAHAMVADELFETDALAAARPFFARSLPAIWRSPRMVAKAMVTSLPEYLARLVVRLARQRRK
jgi:glycosyltransferase involved in cell wall biosynthesis